MSTPEMRTEYRVVAHGERLPLTVIQEPVRSLGAARKIVARSGARNVRVQSRVCSGWTDQPAAKEAQGG